MSINKANFKNFSGYLYVNFPVLIRFLNYARITNVKTVFSASERVNYYVY